MNLNDELKQTLADFVTSHTDVAFDAQLITTPPQPEMGDLAIPLFTVAKELKGNPAALAQELAGKAVPQGCTQLQAAGPYLNVFIDPRFMNERVITGIRAGLHADKPLKGQRIMVEYFSPNTNKPMTVGHVRNLTLGASIARLYEAAGAKVIRATLFNDRGIAIAKSMVAYDLFGKGKTPTSEKMKPDHFVGHYYVLFGREAEKDPKLEEMAREYLVLWEKGDKRMRKLWKQMNAWVYAGFKETLATLAEGDFDVTYYESDIYDKAKDVVRRHVGQGILQQGDEGEIYADLEALGLPNKIVLRKDGTSLYITQDLYLAELKAQKKLDKSIYVVADEQNLQLKQLFAILQALEASTDKYHHLSYGMMRLPEGKIKSREGFGRALADALLGETEALARVEIAKRQEQLSDKEVARIATQLMRAAIKFYILNVDAKKTMVFDPQEAVSFTGKTGPYVQYTAVRLRSILKKAKAPKAFLADLLEHYLERQALNLLRGYEEVCMRALEQHNPALLTHYLYDLAQLMNRYYHDVPVLKAEAELQKARLALIDAVERVLSDGLALIGIEVPKQM